VGGAAGGELAHLVGAFLAHAFVVEFADLRFLTRRERKGGA
jgi:hypothetical protein